MKKAILFKSHTVRNCTCCVKKVFHFITTFAKISTGILFPVLELYSYDFLLSRWKKLIFSYKIVIGIADSDADVIIHIENVYVDMTL